MTGERPCRRARETTATVGLPTSYRVDELDLLGREVDVRGVAALLLGQVVAVPAGLAADVQDHGVGVAGGGDRGRDVNRIGGEHAGAGDRGDLGVREQLADRLGERDCGMVGPGVVLHVPLRSLHLRAQHRKIGRGRSTGRPTPIVSRPKSVGGSRRASSLLWRAAARR
jgi:hypothetical protein